MSNIEIFDFDKLEWVDYVDDGSDLEGAVIYEVVYYEDGTFRVRLSGLYVTEKKDK